MRPKNSAISAFMRACVAPGVPGETLCAGPTSCSGIGATRRGDEKDARPRAGAGAVRRPAGFKHPKDAVFMEALSRNAVGKALKSALRDLVG